MAEWHLVMPGRAELLTDIDRSIAHMHSRVDLGAPRDKEIAKLHKYLLLLLSKLRCVDVAMATRISKHLLAYGVFSHEQLITFNACLRAAVSAKRDKHTTLPMQNLDALEHCFLQSDWDQLVELGEQPKQTSDPLEDILAIRMHRLGIVCPDADTLEKANAIIQAVMRYAKETPTATRLVRRALQKKLKKLDKASPWPFPYITNYPRSPFELPVEVLQHAYGDARPITKFGIFEPNRILHSSLLIPTTRYNKPRVEQTQPPVELVSHQGASLSPTAQLPNMMNPGSFAAMMNSGPFAQQCNMVNGMQHGALGTQAGYGDHACPCNLGTETMGIITVPLAGHQIQPRSKRKKMVVRAMTR